MHSETLANEVKEPPSEHPQVQAVCQLKFTLKGWSAVYKTVRGSGTLTCDNGQKAKVKLQAKGGGLTAARSAVRDGLGKFSKVTDIGELFGTYVGPPSGGAMIMKKGRLCMNKPFWFYSTHRRLVFRFLEGSQAATPNSAPTPAVNAIAKAPQNVTRMIEVITGAPPARADEKPNSARKNSELPATLHISV